MNTRNLEQPYLFIAASLTGGNELSITLEPGVAGIIDSVQIVTLGAIASEQLEVQCQLNGAPFVLFTGSEGFDQAGPTTFPPGVVVTAGDTITAYSITSGTTWEWTMIVSGRIWGTGKDIPG